MSPRTYIQGIYHILAMNTEESIRHAVTNSSACSIGAVAGTITAVKGLGAKQGKLVDYTTSYDVIGDMSSFVGYASIIFTE